MHIPNKCAVDRVRLVTVQGGRVVEWSSGQGGWSVHDCHGGLGGPDAYCGPYGLGDKASQGGPGGQVVRWSDGQVVRWSGGQVVK